MTANQTQANATGQAPVAPPRTSPTGALWAVLEEGTHHFQHGPIDLMIRVDVKPDGVHVQAPDVSKDGPNAGKANGRRFDQGPASPSSSQQRLEAAWQRFETILPELVTELPQLRRPVPANGVAGSGNGASIEVNGHTVQHAEGSETQACARANAWCSNFSSPVAQRMAQACWPYRHDFVTPMAAVAGAVADEVLQSLLADNGINGTPELATSGACRTAEAEAAHSTLRRAYVNNGGDIALYLAPGESFTVGLVSNPDAVTINAASGAITPDGAFTIAHHHGIGGIATSGWRGRSFSLGIADSVTVFAATAAQADVAATLIANQVNIDHPAIQRAPANTLKDDTDLGGRLVTTHVGPLPCDVVDQALQHGVSVARQWQRQGYIAGAALVLQGQVHLVLPHHLQNTSQPPQHAQNAV